MGLLRAAGTIRLNFGRRPWHRLKRPRLPTLYALFTWTRIIHPRFRSTLIDPVVEELRRGDAPRPAARSRSGSPSPREKLGRWTEIVAMQLRTVDEFRPLAPSIVQRSEEGIPSRLAKSGETGGARVNSSDEAPLEAT